MNKVVITVEDFGGADKAKEFFDKWNKVCHCELQECIYDGEDEYSPDIYSNFEDHINYAISEQDDEDLPPKVVEKYYSSEDENGYCENWELSDEVKTIAHESCKRNLTVEVDWCSEHYDEEDDYNYDDNYDDEEDEYYGDYDDEDYNEDSANDEEKACHEILAILSKYDVEIRGDELGGVWIGHNKIS